MSIDGRLCACASESYRSLPGQQDVRAAVPPSGYFFWKGLFDRIAAAVLLVPGLPLIGVLIGLIRLTSRGPGLYSQVRTGKDGREFTMFKLRSMRQDAEAGTGAVWTKANDSRITPLGRILRKLHLDELPQLFNVLRGEMSLIGPRPERPEFVCVLEEQIEGYRNRLAVLPGVTGLAQINLPPDSDLDSVRRKQALDLMYVQTASAWLDFRILLCTVLRMFGLKGKSVTSLLAVHRKVRLSTSQPTAPATTTASIPAIEATADSAADQRATVGTTPDRLCPQAIRETVTWDDTDEFTPIKSEHSQVSGGRLPGSEQEPDAPSPRQPRTAVPKPR